MVKFILICHILDNLISILVLSHNLLLIMKMKNGLDLALIIHEIILDLKQQLIN